MHGVCALLCTLVIILPTECISLQLHIHVPARVHPFFGAFIIFFFFFFCYHCCYYFCCYYCCYFYLCCCYYFCYCCCFFFPFQHYEEVGGHLPQVRKAWEEPMGGGKHHNPPVPRDTARPGGFPEERRRDQMDYGQRNQPDYQREYDPRYEAPFGNRQGYVPQQQQKGPPTIRQGPDSYRVPQSSLQSTTQKTMNDPEFVADMNDYG